MYTDTDSFSLNLTQMQKKILKYFKWDLNTQIAGFKIHNADHNILELHSDITWYQTVFCLSLVGRIHNFIMNGVILVLVSNRWWIDALAYLFMMIKYLSNQPSVIITSIKRFSNICVAVLPQTSSLHNELKWLSMIKLCILGLFL